MRFPFLPLLALFALLLPALGCGDDTPVLTDSGRDTGTRDSGRDTGPRDTGMSDACFPGATCVPTVECQEGRTTCDPLGCEVSVPAAADTVCTGGTCDGSGTCVRTETAMWGASDASMFDAFGGDVAIDGSYAVIGVGSSAAGVYADAAYVFERNARGNWRQVAGILNTSDATAGSFGTAVDIEGETIVIGTHGASHTGAMNAGAVYVFKRAPDGTWAESQTLIASDPTMGQRFGRSVAIGDGHIAVGAYGEAGFVTDDQGLVYVFEDDGLGTGTFEEVARLTVTDGRVGDGLGFSVDIDSTHLISGAPFDNNERGAAYLFDRTAPGTWAELTAGSRLEASDGSLEDRFGIEVSLDGDTMAISSPFAEEGAVINAGAVYIFERQTDMTVTQSQRLVASDPSREALFGALDLVGDMLLVGAPKYDRVGRLEMGIAYRFERAGGSFTEAEKLYRLAPEVGDRFGAAVAASGTVALIGAPGVDRMAAEDVGAVFIFDPIMP
ncbi:MAG: hypothetical protein JRH11_03080 [Deltaproteobacteria bacterium]|nr:hypothetical protein [Deltaproteobacteria bacterium]